MYLYMRLTRGANVFFSLRADTVCILYESRKMSGSSPRFSAPIPTFYTGDIKRGYRGRESRTSQVEQGRNLYHVESRLSVSVTVSENINVYSLLSVQIIVHQVNKCTHKTENSFCKTLMPPSSTYKE